jgi:hypothetical protein
MTKYYPPPWQLEGSGFMVFYQFKPSFVVKSLNTTHPSSGHYKAGLGCLMLVDYQNSDCGAYQELLLIPGKFKFKHKRFHSITDICVSTQASVENGIKNWGIPKFKADFEWNKHDKNQEHICVKQNGELMLDIQFSYASLKFPVSTTFIPLNIVQEYDGQKILTRPKSKGKGQWAKIQKLNINEKLFPDVSILKPLAVVKVSNFKMTFPIPTILTSI